MKIGITQRLFLAILAAALLSVVSMVIIMQWTLDRGFLRYLNNLEQTRLTRLATELEGGYAANGSWRFLRGNQAEWRRLLAASLPEGETRHSDHDQLGPDSDQRQANDESRSSPPPRFMHGFAQRIILLDEAKQAVIAPTGRESGPELRPLRQGESVVGYLGLLPRKQLSDERQLRFIKEQKTAFALVAGIIVLLAAGLSLPLSTRLLRPLAALARATDSLARGNYDSRVPVSSSDELGQLARDFNALAFSLDKNEQARRGWVADISHELRTPLAILLGEIEALQDGIRPLSREAVDSLHGEVLRLRRLVDDLYQLSLSDVGALSYRKENIDLAELLTATVNIYEQGFSDKQLDISVQLPTAAKTIVFADAARLQQLFANLLDNSLKYTDPGGRIEISLCAADKVATVTMEDSAPGVKGSDLGKLFDRLYRVESSRNRSAGGAGLGLAICRNIAIAHEGSISARQSHLGGLLIRVVLPLWGGE